MATARERETEFVRITNAAANRAEEQRARQRRYLFSMSLRTICFVGGCLALLAGIDWLWPILMVGAVILPYIAVVMANAAANLSDGFRLREGDFSRLALESGSEQPREPREL